jgi:membrane associated rhomboid family serine protease
MISTKNILQFAALLYAVYFIGLFIPITKFGIVPRTTSGLIGVFTAPFLHGGIRHLLSNTVPLITLLIALNTIYPTKTVAVFLFVTIAGGLLVWIFGRDANHIGASGLIYGLVAFLIVHGILEKKYIPIGISIAVGIVYGGLIWGIFPSIKSYISWEGHLFGAISGVLIAFLLRNAKTNIPL